MSLNNCTNILLNFLEPLIKLFLIQNNKDKYKVAQRVLSSKKENQDDRFQYAFQNCSAI